MARSMFPLRLSRIVRKPPCRAFHTAFRDLAAHEFTMPAMSPTMVEGNITGWKVKEGDSFNAGDVLLEIETDKAQMDVEAQDDGVMAQILQQAGAKNVKVGARIAITAEAGDDLQTLDTTILGSSKGADQTTESTPIPDETTTSQSGAIPAQDRHISDGSTRNLKYPLFPSVVQLLHENKLADSDVSKMVATGPNGRLLKGDVLAHLGAIASTYPKDQSKRIEALGHLDLSRIEIQPIKPTLDPKPEPSLGRDIPRQVSEGSAKSEVTLPISLKAVNEIRKRIHDTLGIKVDLGTFIARATELCNEDLPRSRSTAFSADELFDAVLGLNKISVSKPSPAFVPYIQAAQSTKSSDHAHPASVRDVIDELTGKFPQISKPVDRSSHTSPEMGTVFFTVEVVPGDEARGKLFLQRLKTTLQSEPGLLVI